MVISPDAHHAPAMRRRLTKRQVSDRVSADVGDTDPPHSGLHPPNRLFQETTSNEVHLSASPQSGRKSHCAYAERFPHMVTTTARSKRNTVRRPIMGSDGDRL